MMNFENVKKILMEGTEEKAQNILQITNTIKENLFLKKSTCYL